MQAQASVLKRNARLWREKLTNNPLYLEYEVSYYYSPIKIPYGLYTDTDIGERE